jgi:hypothetical protein
MTVAGWPDTFTLRIRYPSGPSFSSGSFRSATMRELDGVPMISARGPCTEEAVESCFPRSPCRPRLSSAAAASRVSLDWPATSEPIW